MKIRIGVGIGGASASTGALNELVTGLDDMGFDSLWLSEVLTGQVFDPVVGLSWAAASNPRLKIGTTMLLPGRHVLRLATAPSSAAAGSRTDGCRRSARPRKRRQDAP